MKIYDLIIKKKIFLHQLIKNKAKRLNRSFDNYNFFIANPKTLLDRIFNSLLPLNFIDTFEDYLLIHLKD